MVTRQQSKLLCLPHPKHVLSFAIALSFVSLQVQSKEFSVTPLVDFNSVLAHQELEGQNESAKQGLILQITPGLAAGYKSNRIEFTSLLSAESITRSSDLVADAEDQNSETVSVDASAKINVIKDIATFQIQAKKYQQVTNTQSNGVLADRLLDSDGFVDTFQHNTSFQLQNPIPSKIRAILAFTSSGRTTDAPENDTARVNIIDSISKGLNFQLGNGYRQSFIEWQARFNAQQTDRENGGEITTENIDLKTVTPLYKGVGLALDATKNSFEVDGNVSLTNQLDFKQLGVGLSWKVGAGSEIKLIGYEYQRGSQDTEQYIGGSIDWRVSALTSVQYERNANARGQTDNLTLTQNNRFIKTRATVSQGININSRQGFNSSELGTFVCPLTSQDLSSCYQPDTLTYLPGVGERVVNVNQQELELSEEVVEQTLGQLSIGYDNQSKINASLSYTYSNQKSLEAGRQNLIRQTLSSKFSYRYSSKTSLGVQFTTSESDYFAENIRDLDSSINFNLAKQLTKKLSLNSNLSARTRQSQRQGFDVTDYRLSVAIKYTGF